MSDQKKAKVKQEQYHTLLEHHKFVQFKGTTFIRTSDPIQPYQRLTSDLFATKFYGLFPYASIQQIREVQHLVLATAPNVDHLDHLIGLPDGTTFNTRTLTTTPQDPDDPDPILRSRVAPAPPSSPARDLAFSYMLELANQDEHLAWDMLQGLAPLFLHRKPAGVIWFVGGGANGKSALINAVYRIVGDHLTSMTVSAIEDGRDTLRLSGILGNVCRESSEGRVEDTERYKAIGTHEPFTVHRFHTQEPVTVYPTFHTIFNANNIPVFSDKTEGARRRTLIIPFPAKFKDNPNFEAETFTPDFLSGLLTLILEAAQLIAENNYQYRFSPATQGAKQDYDAEVNSAEAFLKHLRDNKVKAFTNYHLLRIAYENWCADTGLVPLGVTALKRVMSNIALVKRHSFREQGAVRNWYFIDGAVPDPESNSLVSLDNGMHVGLKSDQTEPVKDTAPSGPTQIALGDEW